MTITINTASDSQVIYDAERLTFLQQHELGHGTDRYREGKDDPNYEANPHTFTITHTASGGDYAGVSVGSVAVHITDDDP